MKLKVSLDPNALKQFFVDHVEKIAFGVVVVGFLFLVYQAIARDSLKWGPEELIQDAENAKKNVAATKPNPPKYASYLDISKEFRKPISANGYALETYWEPPKFAENLPRGVPKLYPITDLRCGAGNGAFAMAAPEQEQEASSSFTPSRGQRWAVITGLIQHRKQKDAYDATFVEATQWDPKRDYPDYVFYRVERAEVDPRAETAEPKWTTIRVRDMLALQDLWSRPGTEAVDAAYVPPPRGSVAIAFPLGPLMDRDWGPEVAHPPQIPLLEAFASGQRGAWGGFAMGGASAATREPGAAKQGEPEAGEEPGKAGDAAKKAAAEKPKTVRKRSADEPDEPDAFMPAAGGAPTGGARAARTGGMLAAGGAMPGMMAGAVPGAMPGMMAGGSGPMASRGRAAPRAGTAAEGEVAKVEEREPEYLLFRFFDFTVEPGKHYRYRVKLVLSNPNYGMAPHYLEKDGMEKPQFLETEWSEPSPTVAVPLDSQALTVAAKPDGSASMMLVRFNMEDGVATSEKFDVSRGQLLDFRNRTGIAVPTRGTGMGGDSDAREKKVDYLTNSLLLDVAGGGRLPGRDRNLLEPASVLLLDPEGALVVRNEIDDLSEVELRKQAETRPKGVVAGGAGAMPGLEPPPPGAKGPKPKGEKKPKGGAKGSGMAGTGAMPGMTPGMMPAGMMGPGAPGGVGDLDDGPKRGKSGKRRGGS
jgi:hypothetical protein